MSFLVILAEVPRQEAKPLKQSHPKKKEKKAKPKVKSKEKTKKEDAEPATETHPTPQATVIQVKPAPEDDEFWGFYDQPFTQS